MLYQKKLIGFLIGLLLVSGCYKDKTVIFEIGDEITRTVGFSADIIPVFNNSCNTNGCHSTGGKTPDLSVSNAYNSLVLGNYISKEDPQSSALYLWMTGKKGTPMPVAGINKDYNALVLAWLKQGAQNN